MMTSKALDLVSSLMASVDGVKDKLSDGEYLNLCNLLMSLNTEIKTINEEPNLSEAESDNDEEADAEAERLEETLNNSTIQLDERIRIMVEWLNSIRITGQTKEQIFNNYLRRISTEEEESDYNRFFICACGCSVRFTIIQEHLENHPEYYI